MSSKAFEERTKEEGDRVNMLKDNPAAYANSKNRAVRASRNFWSGFFFGLGLVAFIDEAVFHQILHWHHFYDQSTPAAGLISDGVFHAFSWFATVGALFLLADLRRRNAFWPKRWIGSVFLGAGAFQLYDGVVQHKLLQLHQIRYDVELLPYDLMWNISAAVLLIIGIILLLQTRKERIEARAGR